MSGDIYSSLRWVASAKLFTQVVSWASTILVMRLLAPEDYGLVAMAGVFSGFLIFLGDFGLSTAIISRRETDPEVLRAAFGVSLLGGLTLFLLVFAIAPLIAQFFSQPELTGLVRFSGILFLALGLSTVPRATLATDMRFREISIAGIASALVTTFTTLAIAWLDRGPWALVIGTVAGGVSRAIQLQWHAGRMLRPSLALGRLRGLFRLSGYLMAQSAAYYWYEQIDAVIVGRRLGDDPLGFLVAGKSLAFMPVSKVAEVTNQVALPAFSRLQQDPSGAADAYAKAVRLSAIVSFPAMWGLAAMAPDLVPVLLGSKWQESIVIIQLLSLATPLRLTASLAGVSLQGIGRPDLSFRYTVETLMLAGVLVLVGVHWGLAGVSVAMVVSIATGFVLGLRAVAVCIPIQRLIAHELLRAAIPALLMAACILVGRHVLADFSSPSRLTVCALVGAVTWPIAAWATSRFQFNELLEVARTFLKL